jgi:hypothetical protein
MRYGFTKQGDFVVVDDSRRVSSFGFVTSPYADSAKKNAEQTAKRMLAAVWKECPEHIRESHYEQSCKALEHAA